MVLLYSFLGFRSSGMWRCVAGWVVSDVSKELVAFILKESKTRKELHCYGLWDTLQNTSCKWWWLLNYFMEIAIGDCVFRDIYKVRHNCGTLLQKLFNSLMHYHGSVMFGLGSGHPCYVGCWNQDIKCVIYTILSGKSIWMISVITYYFALRVMK